MARVGNNSNVNHAANPFGDGARVKQKGGKWVPAAPPIVPARTSNVNATAPRASLSKLQNNTVDLNQLAAQMLSISTQANQLGTIASNAQTNMNAEATLQTMKQTTETGLMTSLRNGNETLAKIWKAGSEAVKGLV